MEIKNQKRQLSMAIYLKRSEIPCAVFWIEKNFYKIWNQDIKILATDFRTIL